MSDLQIPCGEFDLLEPIGAGGMGEVWRGQHRRSGREVAVKVMTSELARYDPYVERFHREVRAHARLTHPHIVRLFDLGTVGAEAAERSEGRVAEGSPYLAMDYVDGGTLRSGIVVSNWSTAERILRQVLSGLAYAHARSVVHRDLKPANILCDLESGLQVRVSDFGLAFEVPSGEGQRSQTTDLRGGTPHYMAPEQFRGEWRRYGPWTDLYAVGCIAYEIVSGRRPYPGMNPEEIATAHLVDPVPDLDPLYPVPDGLEAVIETLMQKQPERRFWAAADAARELQRVSEEFSPPDSGDGPTEVHPLEDTDGDPGGLEQWEVLDDVDSTSSATETKTVATPPIPTPSSDASGEESSARDLRAPEEGRARQGGERPGGPPRLSETWRRGWEEDERELRSPLGLFDLREVPFVGRERERDRLWTALSDVVEEGAKRSVVVSGPLGVGRSRLVEWIARRGMEFGACTLLRATHTAFGGRGDGLTELLQEIFNTWEMTRGEVREQLERTLKAWRDEETDDEALELDVRALSELLRPVGMQSRSWKATYEFSSLTERLAVVERVLRKLCARRPVFLWLDDVHRSEASLEFARYLEEESPATSLMVAMTVSEQAVAGSEGPGALQEWVGGSGAEQIELEALEREEHRELVERLLPLEPDLRSELVDQTAGSPLFAVELLRDWVDAGALEFSEGFYQLDPEFGRPFPEDLDGLWRRRLERVVEPLAEEHRDESRRSIELAAVLGAEIDDSEWRVACRRPGLDPQDEVLEQLFALGLAMPEPSGWRFVHEMFVQSLIRRARAAGRYRRYSVACAEAIEHCYPSRSRETADRRAAHLREGGALERAAEVSRLATAYALDIESYGKARELLESRRKILDELGAGGEEKSRIQQKVLELRLKLNQGKADEAEALVDEILEVASRESWASIEATTLVRKASLLHRRGEQREALQVLDRAEATYRALGESRGVARAELRRAVTQTWAGNYEAAIASAKEARSRFESIGATVAACNAQQWEVYALIYLGEYDRAEVAVKTLLERAREVGHRGTERECLNQLGEIARYRENWERAREYYGLFERFNDQLGLFDTLVGTLNLAMVDFGVGAFDAAAAKFETLLESAREQGARHLIPTIQLGRLAVCAGEGDWSNWDRRLEEVREALRTLETREPSLPWLANRILEFVREADRPDAAEEIEAVRRELEPEAGGG